ncbi:CRISPR-associated protein Cas4 [Endozoicomonas sp. Mp262]|uniref:CRISPR-associated protein Cas4 n=1 Tax=Endozoicomonas sp. Mp262 TaxID=2919499 RepID=UPI0021DF7F72
MAEDQHLIPLSALQHYAYCPRQCALIHLEQAWSENWFTAQGQLLHQRVDSGEPETRRGIRFERGVLVNAPELGLTGKLDLLELEKATGRYTPVEYKRGKPKIEDWDRIQLCAQGLCLEEMLGTSIEAGALWYWQTRHREVVALDTSLRQKTRNIIGAVRKQFDSKLTPAEAAKKQRCRACSLIDLCQPELLRVDQSDQYIKALFRE